SIANAELPSVDTEPRQSLRDADLLEHLEGPGVHDGGARRIRSCRLLINHCDVLAMPGQRGGNRQSHRPRPYHQYLGPRRKLTNHGLPSLTVNTVGQILVDLDSRALPLSLLR